MIPKNPFSPRILIRYFRESRSMDHVVYVDHKAGELEKLEKMRAMYKAVPGGIATVKGKGKACGGAHYTRDCGKHLPRSLTEEFVDKVDPDVTALSKAPYRREKSQGKKTGKKNSKSKSK